MVFDYYKSDKDDNQVTHIKINEHLDDQSSFVRYYDGGSTLWLADKKSVEYIKEECFGEIGYYFSVCSWEVTLDKWEFPLLIEVHCQEFHNAPFPMIRIMLGIDPGGWAKGWSVSTFAEKFEKEVKSLKDDKITYYQDGGIHNCLVGLDFSVSDKKVGIAEALDSALSITTQLLVTTNSQLVASVDQDSVLQHFQFPNEIKTACKQYLIYFTQFLADLGISAETDIVEQPGNTLFKITPTDKTQALDQIREALNIYLYAPGSKNFQDVSDNHNIAIQQWQANIFHLQGQLMLAKSIHQADQATIENLQLSNFRYKELLGSHDQPFKEKERESVIKGFVEIKRFEGKWFSVNLPEILRKLKRTFK